MHQGASLQFAEVEQLSTREVMKVLYEDNHIIVVYKEVGELVQGDRTGDVPLVDDVKRYLKETYAKPGNVFCGVVHRIDRPAQGLVIFARTSKALSRLNDMLRRGDIHKTYLAVVEGRRSESEATLENYLLSDGRTNKTRVVPASTPDAQKAVLKYKVRGTGDRYSLLEVSLLTGRKHQIRCQLSATGTPIKGDLKYGARRSNPDGGISLLAWRLEFVHPVSKKAMSILAPLPEHALWHLGERRDAPRCVRPDILDTDSTQ